MALKEKCFPTIPNGIFVIFLKWIWISKKKDMNLTKKPKKKREDMKNCKKFEKSNI